MPQRQSCKTLSSGQRVIGRNNQGWFSFSITHRIYTSREQLPLWKFLRNSWCLEVQLSPAALRVQGDCPTPWMPLWMSVPSPCGHLFPCPHGWPPSEIEVGSDPSGDSHCFQFHSRQAFKGKMPSSLIFSHHSHILMFVISRCFSWFGRIHLQWLISAEMQTSISN